MPAKPLLKPSQANRKFSTFSAYRRETGRIAILPAKMSASRKSLQVAGGEHTLAEGEFDTFVSAKVF